MRLILTVDVEGVHGRQPWRDMVYGCLPGGAEGGVFRIASEFERYGFAGIFFLDVYEHTLWGEKPIRFTGEELLRRGHDVQLHTHPGWRVDHSDFPALRSYKRRNSYSQTGNLMSDHNAEGQAAILEHGVELFRKWFGMRPMAHRSGGYSFNADTVTALKSTGFGIDSSMYPGHPNCLHVSGKNTLVDLGGILELPVTTCWTRFSALGCSFRKEMKTDIDTSTLPELQEFGQMMSGCDDVIMNLFLHSYSLLELHRKYYRLRLSKAKVSKLRRFLAWAAGRHARVLDSNGILESRARGELQASGLTREGPDVQVNAHVAMLALRKIRNRLLPIDGEV